MSGTLDIQGTKASKGGVPFGHGRPRNWGEITVPSGGVVTASYLVMTGGAIIISNSGKMTLGQHRDVALSERSACDDVRRQTWICRTRRSGSIRGQHDLIHWRDARQRRAQHLGHPLEHRNLGPTASCCSVGPTRCSCTTTGTATATTSTPRPRHPSSATSATATSPAARRPTRAVSVTDMKNARVPDARRSVVGALAPSLARWGSCARGAAVVRSQGHGLPVAVVPRRSSARCGRGRARSRSRHATA